MLEGAVHLLQPRSDQSIEANCVTETPMCEYGCQQWLRLIGKVKHVTDHCSLFIFKKKNKISTMFVPLGSICENEPKGEPKNSE